LKRFGQTEETDVQGSRARLALGDTRRVGAAILNSHAIMHRYGASPPTVVYERYASYARLGSRLQKRGSFWVIESNGLFFREATESRGSLFSARLARMSELGTYRMADLVVAVTESIRREILREAELPPDRVVVVPNGIEPVDWGSPHASGFTRPPGAYVIGFIGQIVQWQGLSDLLSVLPSLPANVHVCIVGDGPAQAELQTMARELGCHGRVTFTGRVGRDQSAALLAEFDAGYAGHRSTNGEETYHSPLKVYEYCGAGIPVISSPSEAVRELQGRFPIHVFEPGEPNSLKHAIMKWLQRPLGAEERGRLRESAQVVLSWDNRVRALLGHIQPRLSAKEAGLR
jgi:glycosyltransferase involved in cell wall biosynthesis